MVEPHPPLDEILSRVCRHHPGVTSAYLFGSVARDQTHRQSDLDLGVLLDWNAHPSARDRFEERIRLTAEVGVALRRNDVDLVILNDAPPHLAREIVTRGRRVYCVDNVPDRAFLRTAMLRAADLDPFLRRTRRVKLKALAR